MSRRRLIAGPTVALVACLVGAPEAAAETPEGIASRLATEGITAFHAGDYGRALSLFEEARAAYAGDPVLLYFLAKASEKLGQVEVAIGHYEAYQKAGPDPPHVGQVKGALRRLRAQLLGSVETTCAPVGGMLRLDGGTSSAPCPGVVARVRPGRHRVRVEAPGHLPWDGDVVVPPGEVARLDVRLEPVPGSIVVVTVPRGAHVTIDGKDVGLSPAGPVLVAPGIHVVAVSREGYATATREIAVAVGVSLTVEFVLGAGGASVAGTPPDGAPLGAAVAAPAASASQDMAPARGEAAPGGSPTMWWLAGGAAAVFAVSLGSGVAALVANSDANECAAAGRNAECTVEQWEDHGADARRYALIAALAALVSGGLAAGAVCAAPEEAEGVAVSGSAWATDGKYGVAFHGRF